MQRIELQEGAFLLCEEGWIRPGMADILMRTLTEKVPWKQEKGMYSSFPRLTAYYADEGVNYTYSGVTHKAETWTETLKILKDKVSQVCGSKLNSLLLNLYRDGNDSIGWHTDAEPELGQNPVVVSISLGATRTFCLRHKKGKKHGYIEMPLPDGTLLVMGGTTQHHWMHSVPKATGEVKPRINLTFRKIIK